MPLFVDCQAFFLSSIMKIITGLLLVVPMFGSVAVGVVTCDKGRVMHYFKNIMPFCHKNIRCNAGFEPMYREKRVTCKPCDPNHFSLTDHLSNETVLCEPHHDCPAPELHNITTNNSTTVMASTPNHLPIVGVVSAVLIVAICIIVIVVMKKMYMKQKHTYICNGGLSAPMLP